MQDSTTIDIDQARYNAIFDAQNYLHRDGASLCDLLDALDDPAGFSALCDLHAAFSQPFPDPEAVQTALVLIHRVLEGLAPSALDRIGHKRGMPAPDMACWHGARVSELLARFRHAH
jgi:hypothetical protein